VIVDDENRRPHAPIVAETVRNRIRASRNPEDEIPVVPRIEDCGQARFGPSGRLLTSTRSRSRKSRGGTTACFAKSH
jgi:hypothetical protein